MNRLALSNSGSKAATGSSKAGMLGVPPSPFDVPSGHKAR